MEIVVDLVRVLESGNDFVRVCGGDGDKLRVVVAVAVGAPRTITSRKSSSQNKREAAVANVDFIDPPYSMLSKKKKKKRRGIVAATASHIHDD